MISHLFDELSGTIPEWNERMDESADLKYSQNLVVAREYKHRLHKRLMQVIPMRET